MRQSLLPVHLAIDPAEDARLRARRRRQRLEPKRGQQLRRSGIPRVGDDERLIVQTAEDRRAFMLVHVATLLR
jgi:hypothetical protein